MAMWLLKTEPECYSWSDLEHQKKTVWDGVTNALALKHIRTMKKGDLALVYHTGDERAAVGIAEVKSNPYADTKEHDEKLEDEQYDQPADIAHRGLRTKLHRIDRAKVVLHRKRYREE